MRAKREDTHAPTRSLCAALLVAAVQLTPGPAAAGADGLTRLEPGRHALQASARSRGVELSLKGYAVSRSLGEATASEGKVFVTVEASFKNIIPLQIASGIVVEEVLPGNLGSVGTENVVAHPPGQWFSVAYVLSNVPECIFLLVDGEVPAAIAPAHSGLPGAIPLDRFKVPKLDDVALGKLVFEVPEQLRSLELLLVDSAHGHLRLGILGRAPEPPRPAIGPVADEQVEIGAFGVEEVRRLGEATAPPGQRFAVVRLSFRAKGDVKVDLEDLAFLYDAQRRYTVARGAPAPGALSGPQRLLPSTPVRGALVFEVDEKHGPLAFAVNTTPWPPLPLAPGAGGEPPNASAPRGLLTIADGDTFAVSVHGVRSTAAIGTARPAPGKRFLVLDLTLSNMDPQTDVEFQTGQLVLVDGRSVIQMDAGALPLLARPLTQDADIPPNVSKRFEAVYQVPKGSRRLVLRYSGFNGFQQRALDVK